MWFRRIAFADNVLIFSIAVKKGQTIFIQCFDIDIRMANFEQDLADGMNHYRIPCDFAPTKGLGTLSFVADDTTMLYFVPESNAAATMTVMVLDV